jgi:serine/threonine-protein kinase RsbW
MATFSYSKPGVGVQDLKNIRDFVDKRLTALGVEPESVYDLLLVITEAVTNIIVHGYLGQPGWIKVDIRPDGNDIWMSVNDRAPAFDPTQVPVPNLSTALEQRLVGGMGVHLIRQNVDQIRYRALPGGGNELILIKENAIN